MHKGKSRMVIYNECWGDSFSNNVMLEEPSIHRPSSGEFSITFFQQISIDPMVS
jgi:hypothetical protein